jgi:hypothetical protein
MVDPATEEKLATLGELINTLARLRALLRVPSLREEAARQERFWAEARRALERAAE